MRQYMTESSCKTCHGFRLNEQALSGFMEKYYPLSVDDEIDFFKDLKLSNDE